MSLSALFSEFGVPQSDLRRATGLSRSAVSRLVAHGQSAGARRRARSSTALAPICSSGA